MAASAAPDDDVMRLISRTTDTGPRLGVMLDDDRLVDVIDLDPSLPSTMTGLIDGAEDVLPFLREAVAAGPPATATVRSLADVTLAAPVGRVGKVIAIGKNYRDHATEEGVAPPADPLMFAKFPSAIVGPDAQIEWRSAHSDQVDWEAELAVLIGRRARDVPVETALAHVLGYTCLNDVSARDIQFGDGQWTRGKSLDTFCPVGPWLVTADEIPDPQRLRIRLIVDGEVMQDASTSQMLFGVAELIAYCSRFLTLEPGDLLATGTPGGVGVFRSPPRFLADGNQVVVDIEGIGRLRNRCRVIGG